MQSLSQVKVLRMHQATTLQLSWMDAVRTPLVVLADGVVLRTNRHLEEICPGCFTIGNAFITQVVPDQRELVAEYIERKDARPGMVCLFEAGTHTLRARISSAPLDEMGDAIRLITLTPLDLSDAQEWQYDAREGLLKSLLQQLPLNVFAIDRNGVILYEDSHRTVVRGMFRDHVGKSIYEVHAAEHEFLDDTQRVLAGETIERERDIQGYVFETYYAPIHDSSGAIIGAVGMGIDVTERLRMQQSALETDRLRITLQKEVEVSEMKSKIMRRIAHEFRTPLSTIQLSAQMLERYHERLTIDERERRIEHILRETRHITRLLDDIALVVKSQAQITPINLCDMDLPSLLHKLIEEVRTASAAQHYFAVSVAPEVEHVHADSRLLSIMLQNLLSNAALYSEPGTVIKLQAYGDGEQLILQVSDQGVGILPEELEHVFEVFYRGSNFDERPGLGLGLSLVRDAVTQHHGSIEIESTPGIGTTVTIRLPR